jgi:hypothetical protein
MLSVMTGVTYVYIFSVSQSRYLGSYAYAPLI